MFYPELKGPALDAYRNMVTKLKAKAMAELKLTEDQIVLRDLRPEDFGASSADAYVGGEQAAWEALVNDQTIGDNRFIGICGFFNGSTTNTGTASAMPTIGQLRITRKGSKVRYWYVNPIYNWENKIGFTDDPFTADQNTNITIEAWAYHTASFANWGLIGAVAEKRGVLINP